MKNEILKFIVLNWDIVGPILYGLALEIALRLWPTKNNVSIIDNIWKLFNRAIPNIRIPQEKDEIIETIENNIPKKKNRVLLNVARHVLGFVILLFVSVSANAQIYSNFKGLAFINADSTTARYNASVMQSTYAPAGYLYYNKQSAKWRIFSNGVWSDLNSGGGSGGNFWPLIGTGTIAGANTIDMSTNVVSFNTYDGVSDSLSVQFSNGAVDYTAQSALSNSSIAINGSGFDASSVATNQQSSMINTAQGNQLNSINTTANILAAGFSTSAVSSASWVASTVDASTSFDSRITGTADATNSIVISATNPSFTGLRYSSSYSANYTDRSLTDRGYVLSAKTYAGKQTMFSDATNAGINVGAFAGDPSTLASGDMWYNSSTNQIKTHTNSITGIIPYAQSVIATRVPFFSGTSGELNNDGGFLFNTTNDVLTVGRLVTLSTTTTPAIGVGSFAGDPSSLSNGDIWYNSTTNKFRARENGASVNIIGAGSTPAGSNTQIQFNNGGAFGADSDLTFATDRVTATNATITTDLKVSTLTQGGTIPSVALATTAGAIIDNANFHFDTPNGDLYVGSFSAGTDGVQIRDNQAITAMNPTNGLSISTQTNTTGNGGTITIAGGVVSGGNLNAGDILLTLPAGTGTGDNGRLRISSGANKPTGTAVLVGGTVTINHNAVSANSQIFLTSQIDGGTVGFLRVSARVAGTSFTVTSSSGTDTSTIAYLIIEPN